MTTRVLGSAGATTIIPALGDAVAGLSTACGLVLPELSAQATLFADVGVNLGIELPQVDAQFLASAAGELSLSLPTVNASINADIGGNISVQLSQFQAFAQLVAYINGLSGQINATTYSGTVGGFQSEANLAVPGNPSDTAFSITLSATTSVGIATLKAIFGIP